mmetsp:Transcript_2979/g.4359  ORF Transcript_2979/g.4359 Transcript_2979/m.4359 type:complete len:422 (+) Transcript_2979:19-1284(+)
MDSHKRHSKHDITNMDEASKFELEAFCLCEFDNISGSVISFQYPEKKIDDKEFEPVSKFFITKMELCGRIVTCSTDQYFYLSIPQKINHKRYERNAFSFNFMFVFKKDPLGGPGELIVKRVMTPILKRLSSMFLELEEKYQFLTNPETRDSLPSIIREVRESLNTRKEVNLKIKTGDTTLNQKRLDWATQKEVAIYDVPLFNSKAIQLGEGRIDLTVEKVIPYINGVNCVRHIAMEAQVDEVYVIQAMQQLLFFNRIVMVDIFQYSNQYKIISRTNINKLFQDKALQQRCINYIKLPNMQQSPNMTDVFKFFTQIKPGVSLRTILSRNEGADLLHHKSLVVFGLLYRIIARVDEFPYCEDRESAKDIHEIALHLNGKHCMDELCLEHQISRDEMMDILQDTDCAIILKTRRASPGLLSMYE